MTHFQGSVTSVVYGDKIVKINEANVLERPDPNASHLVNATLFYIHWKANRSEIDECLVSEAPLGLENLYLMPELYCKTEVMSLACKECIWRRKRKGNFAFSYTVTCMIFPP